MNSTVRIGTRGSRLAVWQAELAQRSLARLYPQKHFEIVVITTSGDRLLDTPLPAIGGKGVFTVELEQALRDRSIDLAVHSLKDLPTVHNPGLILGAVMKRGESADVLVSRGGHTVLTLPSGAQVGTSSSRRAAQLLNVRPDINLLDLRGNADTRLRKALDPGGPYDAVLVALAALDRLGLTSAISEVLSDELMLPAPGQGAIAIQCRDEPDSVTMLQGLTHRPTELETIAERAFLEGMGGGCAVPVAARARLGDDGHLSIRGRVLSPDGSQRIDVTAGVQVFPGLEDTRTAREAGLALAEEALHRGAAALLTAAAPAATPAARYGRPQHEQLAQRTAPHES